MTSGPTRPFDPAGAFDIERIAAMRLLSECADDGWFVGDDELGVIFTGAGTFTANGLMSADPDVSVADLDRLLARLGPDKTVRAAQLGSAPSTDHVEWAARLGLVRSVPLPTMTMNLAEPIEPPDHPNLRRIEADDSDGVARCLLLGMGARTLAECAPFSNLALLSLPEVTGFLVTSDDSEVVSVGITIQTTPDVVGLYAIATLPQHRKRGHGTAVTQALVDAARQRGASVAYLQASPLGARVYERVGFSQAAIRTYLF
jgi:GNAT superfamily N-acetyltransferase